MTLKIIKVKPAVKAEESRKKEEKEEEPEYIDEEVLESEENPLVEPVVEKKKNPSLERVRATKNVQSLSSLFKDCDYCGKSCISLINHYQECEIKLATEADQGAGAKVVPRGEKISRAVDLIDKTVHAGPRVSKNKKKYICNVCCYVSESKNNFMRHLQAPKHKINCQFRKQQQLEAARKANAEGNEVRKINLAAKAAEDKVFLVLKE
ncbi:uncharacterized protein LOC141536671 [Cotesia typhae]|uniref:uncharacterized protein LOC141536671 n=1 Tax=Cotesia typhae TaxID=2053667 RepID=UPI003D681EA5